MQFGGVGQYARQTGIQGIFNIVYAGMSLGIKAFQFVEDLSSLSREDQDGITRGHVFTNGICVKVFQRQTFFTHCLSFE
jgi:hypothetical protein